MHPKKPYISVIIDKKIYLNPPRYTRTGRKIDHFGTFWKFSGNSVLGVWNNGKILTLYCLLATHIGIENV